jgi:hypothetical protein
VLHEKHRRRIRDLLTFSRSLLTLVAVAWLAVGCAGKEQPSSAPTTTSEATSKISQTVTYTLTPPNLGCDMGPTACPNGPGPRNLGCDAGPECLLEWADDLVNRCDASALPAAETRALRRLQHLVTKILAANNTAAMHDHRTMMQLYNRLSSDC